MIVSSYYNSKKFNRLYDKGPTGPKGESGITPDKQISVFDFIKVVGGQKKPHQTWERIYNEDKDEVSSFWDHIVIHMVQTFILYI